MTSPSVFLGVDTGGTFTDFVLLSEGTIRVHKVLSSPDAPERAILQGIADLRLDPANLQVIHGSTVATNAVLEGKGVRTAFISNRGFADMLTLGRQARKALYDLQPAAIPPPVGEELCLETAGRLSAQGEILEPLGDRDIEALIARISKLKPRAVAINLLFSFLDDRAEKRIESALQAAFPDDLFIARSSHVLPEFKEYERGMATWLNAYIGPLVDGYLQRLAQALAPAPVTVMQSSGGTLSAEVAGHHGVHLLLSGPAGGLTGARYVAASVGISRLLTFDMGGTSTDVALIDGDIGLTSEGRIGDYPVAVPMVDMHTIGAGGGSIASIDPGGMLQVGPQSAGAAPGPACYGNGGQQPTVTDANLVLGRLLPDAFLGGRMRLDRDAARQAVASIAGPLGLDVEQAALGIIDIANEHMARALRVISVQRGIDPRGFTLACFGGAGGLHACALAENLGMNQIIAPVHAGVLSALGMLAAPRARQLSHTHSGILSDLADDLEALYSDLETRGYEEMQQEGLRKDQITSTRSVDLRYLGQSYTLNVSWQGLAVTQAAFHQQHQQRYGHRLEEPVELVNVRIALSGPSPEPVLKPALNQAPARAGRTRLHGIRQDVSVFEREQLSVGQNLSGPALITETVSTTLIAPGWRGQLDASGNILIHR